MSQTLNGVVADSYSLNRVTESCVYRKLDSAMLVMKATENWV
jgi:hypothetical protein